MNDTVTVKLPNSKEDAMICRPHKLYSQNSENISKVSAEKLYNAKKKYWLLLNLRAGTYLLKVGPCFPLCRVPLLLTTACNFV